jgi:hypothetical protein
MTTTTAPAPKSDLFEGFEFEAAPPREDLQIIAEKTGDTMHQVAPGTWVLGMPEFEVPSHVLCRLVPGPTAGTWTLEPEPFPGWIRVSDDFGRRIGVLGLSQTTIRRLVWGGYVESIRPAPHCTFVSLESLLLHFKRTAVDSNYWTPARMTHWRSLIGSSSDLDLD